MPNTYTDEQWLGLGMRSESEQPHEWVYLGTAMRNRVQSSRFPGSYAEVIAQPRQFSYFDDYQHLAGDLDAMYEAAAQGYAGDHSGWPHNDLDKAIQCAARIIGAEMWELPFRSRVMFFWSPRSMDPPGRQPAWARDMSRLFTPGCVDPWRWIFGEV